MSADGVQWLPGPFRRLLHAVPDTHCYTDFGGVGVLWAACGAPAVPKEMLPVGHQPAVEHVITECVGAGAATIIVATRPGDLVVPSYLDVLRRNGLPVEAVAEDLRHR